MPRAAPWREAHGPPQIKESASALISGAQSGACGLQTTNEAPACILAEPEEETTPSAAIDATTLDADASATHLAHAQRRRAIASAMSCTWPKCRSPACVQGQSARRTATLKR